MPITAKITAPITSVLFLEFPYSDQGLGFILFLIIVIFGIFFRTATWSALVTVFFSLSFCILSPVDLGFSFFLFFL